MIDPRQDGPPPDLPQAQPGAWALTFTFYGLAMVVGIARVLTRIHDRHFGLDDGLIILSMISTTLAIICMYSLFQQIFPPTYAYTEVRHYCLDIVSSVNYAAGMALAKISGLTFLLRIGRHAFNRTVTWILYGDMIFTALGALQLSFFQIFACRPLSALSTCWMTAEPGTCINYQPSVFAYSVGVLIGNIPIIVIPIILASRLQMNQNKKLLVYGLSLLALIDTAITFYRVMRYSTHIWPNPSLNIVSGYFYGLDTAMSAVELCLALTTASLPMIYRPVQNLYRYAKGTYSTHSATRPSDAFKSSAMAGSTGNGPGRSQASNGSGGYISRVGAGILHGPRRIKAELYQLDTINQEDASSSKERVFVAVDSLPERKTPSVKSDRDSDTWRHGA